MKITLKGCLMGMHPSIWKEQLSQNNCVKLPFNLSDVKELHGIQGKLVFVNQTLELLEGDQIGWGVGFLCWKIHWKKKC